MTTASQVNDAVHLIVEASEGRDTSWAAPRSELTILEDTGTDLALRDVTVEGIEQTGDSSTLDSDRELLPKLGEAAVVVVDAPAGDLPGAWQDVIQESAIVGDADVEGVEPCVFGGTGALVKPAMALSSDSLPLFPML